MTYAKQNWFIDTFFPKRIVTIDPVVHQIGHTAVAEALATSKTLESPEAAKLRAELVNSEPPLSPVTAAQPGTPEYHLGLMNQMIETLGARIERANTKRNDQRKAYEQDRHERALAQERSDQEQAAEIAGLVKSLEAYKAAHGVLSVPPPAVSTPTAKPARKRPARQTFDVPPDHEAVRDAEGRATGETRPIIVTE